MRTLKGWKWFKTEYGECYQGFDGYKQYNRHYHGVEFRFKGKDHRLVIGAGSRDYVSLFVEGDYLYVLTENYNLPNVGLDIYYIPNDDSDIDLVSNVFLQSDWDYMALMEIDDPSKAVDKFQDYSDMHKVKLLSRYFEV